MGAGLGLRTDHYSDVLEGRSKLEWFEVITENFLVEGGRPAQILEDVRKNFPLAFHGVSLSIGSVDPLDFSYLKQVKALAQRFEPWMISDHCCWTSVDQESLHDLMPLPFTQEAVAHVANRVKQVQDFLGRRILLENVSSYLTFSHSEMTEWEFLTEISQKADCGILLDINNIYVSSINHGFDPTKFIDGIPQKRVGQFHLAGHTTKKAPDGKIYLIDTHDHPVPEPVWILYEKAVQRFGQISVMIERDANIPQYQELEAEVLRAISIEEKVLATHTEQDPIGTHTRPGATMDAASQSSRF